MSATIEGTVVSISEQGNLVTDIAADRLEAAPRDEQLCVRCDEHETLGLFAPEHDQPEATFIAVVREDGVLELQIVGESAAIMLGIRIGQPVTVRW